MKNERKTEAIVRSHFEKFEQKCLIEEQKSDNLKIQKLLKNASKKGSGVGMPEFIISIKDKPDLIIVIECKSDIKKHKSKNGDKYSEYAVDGILLYAAFLSKEYDVLAIAISGEKKSDAKISHFLHLKGQSKATEIFGDKLLPLQDYIDGYIVSPQKFSQDYGTLLAFSKELNEKLHSKKVPESQRSLLISAILISLQNKAFVKSYQVQATPKNLADALVTTVINELKNANLSEQKIDNLQTAYGFIKTHMALSQEEKVLQDIIESIDTNVNRFMKTHKYFDVLGQFYIEFLRYANSDSGLGIVLTPPHITELFSELADVNKDSIILDNCTGTGGFLIAAMNRMIRDAEGDKTKIKNIKEKQLIGIEYQDHIFALACSNMFIHQDGKTNISHGSCFDPKIMDEVKEKKPNIGFLNPPYPKLDSDPIELEFVLNNLEMLQPNSTCMAIIPMSCVLSNRGKDAILKQKLLQLHTLEAVLSMPEQLFYNNDVGVVTSVLVITAHKPHAKNKKTWFGYFRNDGFKVFKHRGRIETSEWKSIREDWISIFKNREEVNGLSVQKSVSAENEWCAEAYMETDYSKLTENDFIMQLKQYAAFSIMTSE